MDKNEREFKYTYSAPTAEERREIDAIRSRYAPAEQGDVTLSRLRKLDRRVKRLPLALALTLGVIGCLVFGTGLALVLEWAMTAAGIIVSVVGALAAAAAYPALKLLRARLKAVYGDEIMRLCSELLPEEKK